MSIYKQANSEIWWISLSHPDHPRVRRSSGTTDRKEAQRVHDELKAQLWQVAPVSHAKTWGAAVTAWLDVEERSESELLSLRKFGQHFRDRPLSQITGSDIERALSFCKTAGTYMRYRTMIVAILNVAKARKWLRNLPTIPVRKDKKTKTRDWLTHEQWDKLYAALPKHLKPPALFAVSTGLRQANVFGLRWGSVDLARRRVRVEAEDTKGDNSIAVPLNDGAIAALTACQGVHDEFVFTYRGRPMVKPKAGFNDACTRADVPDFTWHGFRHTWATWHVMAGTPLDVLQKLGGWSDLRMVMNYSHHSPGYLAGFADNTRKKT